MKPRLTIFRAVGIYFVNFVLVGPLHAATILLPGVTYYKGSEDLSGKLAFQVWEDSSRKTNSETSASIYEFDLARHSLREVTKSPKGLFIAANEVFCVIHWTENWFAGSSVQTKDTNVFIYSERLRQPRRTNLRKKPNKTVIVNDHVFFELEATNGTRLVDFDLGRGQKQILELTNASRWLYEDYGNLHEPSGQTNTLHFHYNHLGKRLVEGIDYRPGVYTYDVHTGSLQWFGELANDKDDPSKTFRTSEGRQVFFEGPNAPIYGLRLVSSPVNELGSEGVISKRQSIRVLKDFSRLPRIPGNEYTLLQMSPDLKFAFVKRTEPSSGKNGMPAAVNTYYIINASDGETRVLLKNDVQRTSGGFMSEIWWVR